MGGLVRLDALAASGAYRTYKTVVLHDVRGQPVAEMSVVPRLLVQRSMDTMRAARPMTADDRVAALARAGHAFTHGVIAGLTADEYQHMVSRVAGLPISTVRAAAGAVARAAGDSYRCAQRARPGGAVTSWADPFTRGGSAAWTRRGEVVAVHAAGNHPGVHALWLEALALGYRVAVRPSAHEPFTPHRMVTALRQAGFAEDQVMLLPTDHSVATELIRGADLSVVYGGDAVTAQYGLRRDVLAQGPGRSKVLISGDNPLAHIDTIVESVAGQGGVGCTNATAVLVDSDPGGLAAAIAGRMSVLPSLPPEDEKAVLPVHSVSSARSIERYLQRQARGSVAFLGADGIVEELGDNSAVLRPAVFLLDRPDAQQTGTELPFPCVWVAPWSRGSGVRPLRHTLVLTAIGCDQELIDDLVSEPTIGNVHLGDHPTTWYEPGLPHDGYLGEFLMRTKTVIRG
jgi:acyl-CoA reductase-like NAD-dependent aldehyde dehydrogenase